VDSRLSERLHPFPRWWGCAMHIYLSVFTSNMHKHTRGKRERERERERDKTIVLVQLICTRRGFWYWQHGIKEPCDNLEQCSQNSMSHTWSSVSLYRKKHTPSCLNRPAQKGVSGKGLTVRNWLRNLSVRKNYTLEGGG